VNSFRTSDGLPLLDGSYNNDPVKNDQGLKPSDPFTEDTGPLDPRLDWSVGRRTYLPKQAAGVQDLLPTDTV
jgi:hypothetical protein